MSTVLETFFQIPELNALLDEAERKLFKICNELLHSAMKNPHCRSLADGRCQLQPRFS